LKFLTGVYGIGVNITKTHLGPKNKNTTQLLFAKICT